MNGGEYKIKIDKSRNKLVLVSRPSYEDLKEWDLLHIQAFYIHPTLFGFDWQGPKESTPRTYHFGTLQVFKKL